MSLRIACFCCFVLFDSVCHPSALLFAVIDAEDHESTTLGEAVSQGEEHGSLTSTRGTSKVEDLGGGKALSAESSIEIFEP